ncbi:MAG: glycosyltransferase family 2 protein [Nanoarchaeota archaeon]|nr:glycosyltransferase family 2 protein [Nanoarchaeota archaeon]
MTFSIVIPVYNEEEGIKETLTRLNNYLQNKNFETEVIVVNDGSTDRTKEILDNIENIKLINHPYNKGYGASLKTGVKNAQYDWVLLYDGDSQHTPEYIEELIKHSNNYDMVVGAREGYKGPLLRQPGKKLLIWTANYLVQKKIPDLNSGLRLIKKNLFLKYAHIFPNGFSLTTTITLVFFKEGLNIKYIPIKINKRDGKSTIRPIHGLEALMIIFRTITLFSPLRIFLPVSFLFFILSLITSIFQSISMKELNISDATILLFVFSLFLFFFGLLADQISAIRREGK